MQTKVAFMMFLWVLISPRVWAQTGTQVVKGQVKDEASKAGVAGVTVQLLVDGGEISAVSDENGYFRLVGVALGRQSFFVTHQGYEPVTLNNVIVTAGKEVMLNLSLTESVTVLTEVSIAYDRRQDNRITNNDMLAVSARPFSMEETKRYAGSLGDPARMAANFPGIVSTNDTRNDIIIRGNSPSAMLWQLEGLNIPNPSHFGALNSMGGSVSMLNNNNIDKSDFMTSAFPAQYGNALSGVFDLRLRDGNNEKHEFLAQMGFNGFEAGAEGPLGKNNQASYLINARYSTLSTFQSLGLNFGTGGATPAYADVNYKVSAPLSRNGRLSVFGIWGQSSIDILGSEYDPEGQAYGNDYSNRFPRYATNITGLSYQHVLGSQTTASLTIGYSRTNERFDRDSISEADPGIEIRDWHWRFLTNKYSAVLTLNHKFNAKHSLVAGIIEDVTDYSLFNRRLQAGVNERILNDRDGQYGLTQAYAQWKYRATEAFSVVSGLHYQYLSLSGSNSLEPRIGLKYQVSPAHLLGLGYGLHSQTENILTYSAVTNTPAGNIYTNENLGFNKSQHVVLSHDWIISPNTHLKTEVYYQYLFDIPVTRYPSSFSTLNYGADAVPTIRDSLVNEGIGRNYGIEVTLERSFDRGFYYLLTGSLFSSRYRGSDRVWRNTAFNMQNILNILGGKEWKIGRKQRILGVSAKVSWIGGRYLSPVDIEASAADGEMLFDETRAFSEKQRDYFRTDVKFSYRREYSRFTMELALDLQNITNNENIFRYEWNGRYRRLDENLQQGFFPVPFIRFTF